jgi:hypothetical protein
MCHDRYWASTSGNIVRIRYFLGIDLLKIVGFDPPQTQRYTVPVPTVLVRIGKVLAKCVTVFIKQIFPRENCSHAKC